MENRAVTTQNAHMGTGVTAYVIQTNVPTPQQVVNSIHMAEIDVVCMTVHGRESRKCRTICKSGGITHTVRC